MSRRTKSIRPWPFKWRIGSVPSSHYLLPIASLRGELFDAVLYDLDRISPSRRQALLAEIRSEKTGVPIAVYGYCLSEDQAGKLRFHGVAVAQRLHDTLIRTLVNAVRQNLAAVPPDDAITDLTWVNVNA